MSSGAALFLALVKGRDDRHCLERQSICSVDRVPSVLGKKGVSCRDRGWQLLEEQALGLRGGGTCRLISTSCSGWSLMIPLTSL